VPASLANATVALWIDLLPLAYLGGLLYGRSTG
jgi:hypothetical protein